MDLAIIAAAFVIGIVAGLRTFTAPAVLAWSAYLGWIDFSATPFGFMASPITAAVATLLAAGEYVFDKLPGSPARTDPPGLIARVVTGSFSGACLFAAAGPSYLFGALLGAIGGVAGAFGGYLFRTRLVKLLGVKDLFVAVAEDVMAIAIGFAVVRSLM